MKRHRHTPEQVVRKLREGERLLNDAKSLTEVLRHLEVSEATWNRWRNQYGGMKALEAKRLRELERENGRLKKIVADQALDIDMLKELNPGKLLTPERRRRAVVALQTGFGVSERRACVVVANTAPPRGAFVVGPVTRNPSTAVRETSCSTSRSSAPSSGPQVLVEAWRIEYNCYRPYSALAGLTPDEVYARWTTPTQPASRGSWTSYRGPVTCRYDGAVLAHEKPGLTMPDDMPAQCPLQMSRSQMEKEIVDAPKQCIDAHGPITRQNLWSANKRVRPVGSDE